MFNGLLMDDIGQMLISYGPSLRPWGEIRNKYVYTEILMLEPHLSNGKSTLSGLSLLPVVP